MQTTRLVLVTIGYTRLAMPAEVIPYLANSIAVDRWTSKDYTRSEFVRTKNDRIEFQFIDASEILDAAPDDPIAPAPTPVAPITKPALGVLATDKQGAVTVPDLREFVDQWRDGEVF